MTREHDQPQSDLDLNDETVTQLQGDMGITLTIKRPRNDGPGHTDGGDCWCTAYCPTQQCYSYCDADGNAVAC